MSDEDVPADYYQYQPEDEIIENVVKNRIAN
jgi:hypothetical protein